MDQGKHFDGILRDWSFDPHSLSVRLVKGTDGRDVMQMRVDLGVLQLETTGRPDQARFGDHTTFLDSLLEKELVSPDFMMDEDQCFEADREFVQYYHRRICWLRLQHYRRAVQDADHTLALMDFCRDHSPDSDWTESHEHYRIFVLFHRAQASALAAVEDTSPEAAVLAINSGLSTIRDIFVEHEADEEFEGDEMIQRLIQLRESLREEYSLGQTLQERLDEAVETEQYELAARLRDELAKRQST